MKLLATAAMIVAMAGAAMAGDSVTTSVSNVATIIRMGVAPCVVEGSIVAYPGPLGKGLVWGRSKYSPAMAVQSNGFMEYLLWPH